MSTYSMVSSGAYATRVSDDEILALLEEAKKQQDPMVRMAQKVLDVYDGNIVLPLAEIDKVSEPAVANLTFSGVDAMGQAIGSQVPQNFFAQRGDASTARKAARQKKDLIGYWWDESQIDIQLPQWGRFYAAYGASYVMVRPHLKKGCPEYIGLDPLRTFPSGTDVCCEFAITLRRQTRRWVAKRYPEAAGQLWSREGKPSDQIELVEYVDDYEFVVLARTTTNVMYPYAARQQGVIRLTGFKNLAGRCPVMAAGRPGLSGPKSQFAGVLGKYIQRAQLQAYSMIGVRKSVMPEKWIWSADPQMTPSIIEHADALTGDIGIVAGGRIEQMLPQPSQMVPMMEDRLERAERVEARQPAEWGGESSSNVRTDRRGTSIYQATTDLPVAEAHMRFQRLLTEANKCAIDIDKGYWGGTSKSFYVVRGEVEEKIDYDPDVLWSGDADTHRVIYSHPGADSAGLAVELGQRIGMDNLSHHEAQEIDPFVKDPERTRDLIVYEKLQNVVLEGLAAQSQQGALPVVDLARIMQRVKSDKDELEDAVVAQQAEAQQRQAAQAPPTAPEAQPGLSMPGTGVESVQQPPPALGNVGALLSRLQLPAGAPA
jgi:hypothetical protein